MNELEKALYKALENYVTKNGVTPRYINVGRREFDKILQETQWPLMFVPGSRNESSWKGMPLKIVNRASCIEVMPRKHKKQLHHWSREITIERLGKTVINFTLIPKVIVKSR